jgi:hypothetical protein
LRAGQRGVLNLVRETERKADDLLESQMMQTANELILVEIVSARERRRGQEGERQRERERPV